MADKKITELTSLTELAKDDLFVVVDDPSGTPITKKITAEKVLSGLAYTASNSSSDSVGVKAVVTLAGNTTLASATLKGAEFIVNVTAASQNTSYQYGLVAKSLLSGATANVKVEHAAGKFVLDVSNATGTIANTTGLMIEIANTGVRVANLQSFIMLDDKAANSTTAQTLYLFDLKGASANVSVGANSIVLLSNCASTKTADHMIKVRINGSNYWLLASNVAPA
jgi:hypothetical protein